MHVKTLLMVLVGLITLILKTQTADLSSARVLRVSLLEGDVTYQRTDLDRWVELSINTPILEGDKVWVGREGRAEIEFEDGTFARLSAETILEFSRLGDAGSRDIEVHLSQGLATFEVLSASGSFSVHAPLFSVRVRDKASFRLETEAGGSGRLVMFDGRAEVIGTNARLYVRNGEVVRFLSDDADRYYLAANYVKDDWDRWNEERNAYLARVTQDRYHFGDRGWTTADLYNYGTWYDVPTYGRIWRPSMAGDWAPFRSGRWVWYSSFGWTWVSYEPWGWVPYHYGRWAHVQPYGWSWVPGPRYVPWCPGAVNWVQGTQWVGWVPLAPHEPWFGYGHHSVNVFISKNFGHRHGVTYIPVDNFLNGTPVRNFRNPRDPHADGRIIAGQPRVTPTPASRMPVPGSSVVRTFRNEDLEARRNLRERILTAGTSPSPQTPATEFERRREQRSGASASGAQQSLNSSSGAITMPSTTAEPATRRYENWSGSRSGMRTEQRQRIQRLDDPSNHSGSAGRSPTSTWARPTAPVETPPLVQSPSGASGNIDTSPARQRLYEVYRGRVNPGGSDSPPSRQEQRQSPSSRFGTYAPPAPPPAVTNPTGPAPSHVGPPVQPVGRAPSYQPPSNSGGNNSENRSAGRGHPQR